MFNYTLCEKPSTEYKSVNDIDGIGVTLGFVIMAWISVGLLIVYYFTAFDPHISPFQSKEKANLPREGRDERDANPVDSLVFDLMTPIRKWIVGEKDSSKGSEQIFYRCILMVADTQLLTGISIAISGYLTLVKGLPAYFWQTIIYQLWFACLTHLSALTCLRSYLYQHRWSRTWRLMLMTALLGLLLVGFVPVGHFDLVAYNDDGKDKLYNLGHRVINATTMEPVDQSASNQTLYVKASAPAICFLNLDRFKKSEAFVSMGLSNVLLVYGFIIRITKLFRHTSLTLSVKVHGGINSLRDKGVDFWQDRLQKPGAGRGTLWLAAIFLPVQVGFHFTITMLLDLYCSMLLELLSLIASMIWGTFRIFEIRKYAPPSDDEPTEKDDVYTTQWQFGQILPLLLLAVPVISIAEFVYDYFFKKDKDGLGEYSKADSGEVTDEDVEPGPLPTSLDSSSNPDHEPQHPRQENILHGGLEDIELQGLPPNPSLLTPDEQPDVATSTEAPLLQPNSHIPGTAATEKSRSLLSESRTAYEDLWGWSPILIPAPMAVFCTIVVIKGDGSKIFFNFSQWIVAGLIIYLIVLPSMSCWCAIQLLFLLKARRTSLWKRFLRFVVCAAFAALAVSPYVLMYYLGADGFYVLLVPSGFVAFQFFVLVYWSVVASSVLKESLG